MKVYDAVYFTVYDVKLEWAIAYSSYNFYASISAFFDDLKIAGILHVLMTA